jgi:ADP-heptose:LPS heptosyltransferase
MADIPQVLANYDALVGVALGAGLTYGFGALNRRHQEARENETRWYNARFQAYVNLLQAVGQNEVLWVTDPIDEDHRELALSLRAALGTVRLVGSDEVIEVANKLIGAALGDRRNGQELWIVGR